jgi:hypothetical protein
MKADKGISGSSSSSQPKNKKQKQNFVTMTSTIQHIVKK